MQWSLFVQLPSLIENKQYTYAHLGHLIVRLGLGRAVLQAFWLCMAVVL